MHKSLILNVTAAVVLAIMANGGMALAQIQPGQLQGPPAPAGVHSEPGTTVDLPPRPAPFQNARATELSQDKPLAGLKASISLNLPESEQLSESEVTKLDQAAPLLANNGQIVSVFGESRPWMLSTYEWEAPATRHLPLLFEEPNLERLGYNWGVRTHWKGCEGMIQASDCLQPFVSAAHFFGRVPALPYLLGVDKPCEPIYTLGVDRPGSPVLYRQNYIPWSLRGALYEAGVIVGLVYAIP